jgi:hypothetical protein
MIPGRAWSPALTRVAGRDYSSIRRAPGVRKPISRRSSRGDQTDLTASGRTRKLRAATMRRVPEQDGASDSPKPVIWPFISMRSDRDARGDIGLPGKV